ncbi:hypothetical protein L3X38_027291 [Prunus dulcis]|uniref:Uncharacterized protein n=1 Tax=Prunus dulcis TaxID=3755 RepID=A0AAD4Z069_PRUDU|nr:hypothetical protein L3X38_027291 [Prunus dulcis]
MKIRVELPPLFQRIYVCLDACKKGFLAGYKPIIGVDGCNLKDHFSDQEKFITCNFAARCIEFCESICLCLCESNCFCLCESNYFCLYESICFRAFNSKLRSKAVGGLQ